MSNNKPKYPVYVPSKNRAAMCYTAKFFLNDGVDFKIVVEPGQLESYLKYFDKDLILVLPEDDMRLLGARLWIREHSIANGFDRHWQFDDNIRHMGRLHGGKRIYCNANVGIKVVEDFTDRYENIGISGFNYYMFAPNYTKYPYVKNCHVYSASLINNRMPYKWRLFYNDDTDICLQVLDGGMCTVLFNAFLVQKIKTMLVGGGNTEDLYKKDGRLIMARTLEEMWPQYVTTKWRFGRPQHVVKNSWKDFKTPLKRRKDIDWDDVSAKKWDIGLVKLSEPKAESLRKFFDSQK